MASQLWLPATPSRPCAPALALALALGFNPPIESRLVQRSSATSLEKQSRSIFFGESQKCLYITGNRKWSSIVRAALDPDLHAVLELASDAELLELSNILYGRSLLSPLLKSMTPGDGSQKLQVRDKKQEHEPEPEPEGRDAAIKRLESRFLFLGADAKAVLRGRRPTYRDVLLRVRVKLNVPCSIKLSTEDLEAEIFLHLLQQYSSSKPETSLSSPWKLQDKTFAAKANNVTKNPKNWLKLGGEEILKVVLKGGSMFTISTLQNMVARRLGGKVLVETARYQVAKEVLKKGGQAAASKLQSHVAMLAARQGLVGAASRYMALQRTSMMLGPLLWGTFFADMLIRSVGTDYARVVKAIYAFAQIRLLRTYGWTCAQRTISN